jgi:hypothetical protein
MVDKIELKEIEEAIKEVKLEKFKNKECKCRTD